jgi:hypothetical protein
VSKTRRELITGAYGELGISNEFDVSPDELTGAVTRLNSLMATWNARNLRVGYSPGTGLDEATGIVDAADDAVTLNLAIRLAPSVGKIPHPSLVVDARRAYLALLTQRVKLIPVQLPAEMPAGAGNRRYTDRVFVSPPSDPVETGSGGIIDGVDTL